MIAGLVVLGYIAKVGQALAAAGGPIVVTERSAIIYGDISDPLRLIMENQQALTIAVSALKSLTTSIHFIAGFNALVVYFLLMSRGLKCLSKVSSAWRKPALVAYYASLLATLLMFASTALLHYYFSTIEQHVISEGRLSPEVFETSVLKAVALVLGVIAPLGYACCTLSFAIFGYVCYKFYDDMNIWQTVVGYALIFFESVVLEIIFTRGTLVLFGLTSFKWFFTLVGWILVIWGFYRAGKMLEWGDMVIAGEPPNAVIVYKDFIEIETTG